MTNPNFAKTKKKKGKRGKIEHKKEKLSDSQPTEQYFKLYLTLLTF